MELVLLWILFGIAGAAVLSRSNKAGTGCLLGALLGPIGLIIAFVMRGNAQLEEAEERREKKKKSKRRRQLESERAIREEKVRQLGETAQEIRDERECPFCAERILKKARVCKHCGRDVERLD